MLRGRRVPPGCGGRKPPRRIDPSNAAHGGSPAGRRGDFRTARGCRQEQGVIPTVMAFLPIALIVVQLGAPAASEPATLRCTNPFSGTTRDVAIDHARRTADSFPADITDKTIKWHDVTRGWRYEFDRASGELTIV